MLDSQHAKWNATLGRICEDISRSMGELDRYESQWTIHFQPAASTIKPDQLFAWLERRLGAWDAKLREAAELADSVASELGERESALLRWLTMFERWRDLIQHRKEPSGPTTG